MNPTVKKKIDKKMEKKGRSNKKEIQRTYQPPPSEGSSSKKEIIEPPKIHRNMRLICDVFRISEQTRYVLRTFDATTLEDFSFMTEEDFADLVVSQVRIGKPLPPLQQRKLFVLLSWVRSLPATIDTNNNNNNSNNNSGERSSRRTKYRESVTSRDNEILSDVPLLDLDGPATSNDRSATTGGGTAGEHRALSRRESENERVTLSLPMRDDTRRIS
mmetsp:Transcript_31605/g.60354  ORF Transcript_31605/g.60354 Transcript_31605/m.60354 type:complete len:216 (+) Transcript_31605:356-1003(+)